MEQRWTQGVGRARLPNYENMLAGRPVLPVQSTQPLRAAEPRVVWVHGSAAFRGCVGNTNERDLSRLFSSAFLEPRPTSFGHWTP